MQTHTPAPIKSKVVSNPVRVPVNRQALRVLLENKDWLAEPLPEMKSGPSNAEFEEVKARLKTEFNSHAETRDKLGDANARIRALSHANLRLENQNSELKTRIKDLEQALAQFEAFISRLKNGG